MMFVVATPTHAALPELAVDGAVLVWVDPGMQGSSQHTFSRRGNVDLAGAIAEARNRGSRVWVEVRTPAGIHGVPDTVGLWLRGSEVHGDGDSVSTLVLIRAAASSGRPFLVEGLGRRGMAAALAVGAAGVVIDAHTWDLDGVLIEGHRALLQGRNGRDTGSSRQLGGPVLAGWWRDPGSGIPAPQSIGDRPLEGSLSAWLPAFIADVLRRVSLARTAQVTLADPLGTGVPIVQGPMANVSERPELAVAVRAAGALPFCALGALRPDAAEAVIHGMRAVRAPWGAGVIGFDVMPHRDAHLALIPPGTPVILAGANPNLALELQQRGLEPWLHTPSARLAKRAVRLGVKAIVLEGREAGGHVGTLTSVGLWEETLAALQDEPSTLIVLAGGIGDAVSAAFAGAMASEAHLAGHRIALQVGTAFFFTHEIVEAQQITGVYQQAALSADHTVLVGDTVNLPLRCAPNAFTQQAIALEHSQLDEPLHTRRARVEALNLGRTRVAAKGIERAPQGGYQRVPAKKQIDEGAFTMGEGALVTTELTTVAALVDQLTRGAQQVLDRTADARSPWGGAVAVDTAAPTPTHATAMAAGPRDAIAIIGLGCVLPGAPDVPAFWRLLLHGMNAIGPVPEARWSPSRYFDPTPASSSTRAYVRMGGFVDGPAFDPVSFGIPPSVVPSMDRAQILALLAAKEAMAGVVIPDRRRAAVILGNSMGGEHVKSLAVRVRHREVLAALGVLGDPDTEAEVEAALAATLPPVDVESMSGLLSNVIAGRIASWLDLMGGNLTVDAACAASLAAITTAVDWLRLGRCDLVVTGGVDADMSPETYVGFCRTHALSRHGGRPFSTEADGFVMGEGAAVLVLKRLADAQRDGDTIHAVIRGVGVASDGRSAGITAPRREGQLLAMQRAWAESGSTPGQADLLEAHGTGTALGDRTELEAVAQAMAGSRPWLGTVKSQIGHLKGAAGAAGILKATLALAHRTVPPTLHAAPCIAAASAVRLPNRAGALPAHARAGVSAFGFGGTDFHVALESWGEGPEHPEQPGEWSTAAPRVLAFGAADRASLAISIERGHDRTPEELVTYPFRLVCIGDPAGLAAWVRDGGEGAFGRRAWLAHGPILPPVWVFPGQGSHRDGAFEAVRRLPAAAALFDELGIDHLDSSADPAAQHHLLVTLGCAWTAVLQHVPVAGVIGHSVGELAALVAAGRLAPHAAIRLANARGGALAGCEPGAMIALACSEAEAVALDTGLHVAAANSPVSTVLAGPVAAVDALRLPEGLRHQRLDVERAFHTPAVAPAQAALATALADVQLTPGAPWWSNVQGPGSDAERLVQAVTAPVRFMDSVLGAAEAGHRLFLHVGPGAALSRHIERTVPDATVIALQPDRDGDLADTVRAAAQLLAHGHPGLLRALPGLFVELPFPQAPPERPQAGRRLSDAKVDQLRAAALQILHTLDGTAPAPPAPSPVVVEPPASAAPAPVPLADDVRSVVIASIAEVTGYPVSALVGGARLDTDLGIDSIRKLEIVGLVQDRLGVVLDESALAEAGPLDLDGLVAWIEAPRTAPEPKRGPGGPRLWRVLELARPATSPTATTSLPALLRLLAEGPCTLDPTVPTHHAARRYEDIAAREAGRPANHRGMPAEFPLPALPTVALPERPVVLATGGATGIVVPCLEALTGARGVLLGRRADQPAPDGFLYVQCDLTDAAAVEAAVEACIQRFGRIDLVVHGAGVLRDRPTAELTPADLDAVLAPKVQGALHLLAATADHQPRWVVFSSVAGPLRNPAQAAYAAANAWLEQLVLTGSSPHVAIRWSAWSGVGMASDPALQRLLASRGIDSLTPAEGSTLFLEALRHRGVVWAAHAPPPSPSLPWPLSEADGEGFVVRLDPQDPLLTDHSVNGAALVPGAVWLAALLTAARCQDPGPRTWAVHDLEILAPTFVREPIEVRVVLDGGARVLRGDRVVATARLEPIDALGQTSHPGVLNAPSAAGLYGPTQLFHGPSWQMLRRARFTAERADADLRINGVDPLATLVDGVHQLLASWAGETTGRLGLPTGATRWDVGPQSASAEVRVELTGHAEGDTILGDVRVFDANGTIVLRGAGVRLQASTAWGTRV